MDKKEDKIAMNKFKGTVKQCNTVELSAIKRTAVGKHILYYHLQQGINLERTCVRYLKSS